MRERHRHNFGDVLKALRHVSRDLDDIKADLAEIATLLRPLNSRTFYLLLVLIIAVCALAGIRLVLPPAPA